MLVLKSILNNRIIKDTIIYFFVWEGHKLDKPMPNYIFNILTFNNPYLVVHKIILRSSLGDELAQDDALKDEWW